MKLRIKGNSIRLRLSQTEVTSLAKNGRIEETTRIGDVTFTYRVVAAPKGMLNASLHDSTMTISIARPLIQEWAASDMISMEATCQEETTPLKILVEKDFKCLKDRPREDESDLFPHPNEKTEKC